MSRAIFSSKWTHSDSERQFENVTVTIYLIAIDRSHRQKERQVFIPGKSKIVRPTDV